MGADSELRQEGGREVSDEMNLARNMVRSLKAQAGLPGPTTTLLASMNVQPPANLSEDDLN